MKRKDALENFKIFSDMEEPLEYSRTASSLSKLYGNTLEKFYSFIKNYPEQIKKMNIDSILSIDKYDNINRNKNPLRIFDVKSIKMFIQSLRNKENKLKRRLKFPYNEKKKKLNILYHSLLSRIKKKTIDYVKQRKINEMKKPEKPEVGRYAPIYDSIEKHRPNIILGLKKYEHNQQIEEKKERSENIKNKTIYKIHRTNNIKGLNEINNNIFYNTEISKKPRNKRKNYYNNIHCLRFDDYSKRKPFIKTYNYQNDSFYSFQKEKIKNLKGNVLFNRFSKTRGYFDEIIERKKSIPSVAFYRPKYTFINDKIFTTFFEGKDRAKKNPKLIKLKKILGSYNITRDYQLFNLLNKNTIHRFEA